MNQNHRLVLCHMGHSSCSVHVEPCFTALFCMQSPIFEIMIVYNHQISQWHSYNSIWGETCHRWRVVLFTMPCLFGKLRRRLRTGETTFTATYHRKTRCLLASMTARSRKRPQPWHCTQYVDEYGGIIAKKTNNKQTQGKLGTPNNHDMNLTCSIEIFFPISRKVLPKIHSRLGAQEDLEVEMTCHD